MRKNIQKTARTIAYITATTLIAATLFACGSKDDEVSKIKDAVEDNSVSEDTKSLKEIFGIVFGDDDEIGAELETETSIVTEVNDDGEEVTRVVTVVQTEDGTKKVVDNNSTISSNNNGSASDNKTSSGNNNSSTPKPNGGNSGNSGNGSNGGSSSGNNTQSGGNDGNISNSSSNNTETKKPVTSSGSNGGGNTGSSNNAGTTTTAATEEVGNGNKWTFNFCTGEKRYHEDAEYYKYYTVGDNLDGIYHSNVTMLYTKDESGKEVINASLMNVPCAEFYYYEWWVCNDCGAKEKVQSALKEKTATAAHSYVDVMTRPATYGWSAWYEKQCTKCEGTAQSDTYVPHLKWGEEYCESYTGLNGLETYNDSSVCRYDKELTDLSMCDHYVEGIDWNTGLVADNYINCSFSYIYKCDSAGNPIYKKTILGYDKNGNAIWNDRPYWVAQHDSGAKILYLTLEDARKRNVLYDWENRDASGKEY